jgi:hypothetical protein
MAIWEAAEELTRRAQRLEDLRLHRLHLIAALVRRREGEAVPEWLQHEARYQTASALAVPVLLARIRAAYDGDILVTKGPEVAARYAEPVLRPYKDLDLLVESAPLAQRALRAAGFVPTGDPAIYVGIHHLRPLMLPGLPVTIEVHTRPKWPARIVAPSFAELREAAVPSATGVDGILALAPAYEAVLNATHAWAHEALACAGRLMDIALMDQEAADGEAAALARRWGCGRLWRASRRAAAALVEDRPRPVAMRVWGRHLATARERTVLESHLARVGGELWGAPRRHVLPDAGAAVAWSARREPGEGWPAKLRRTRGAMQHAFRPKSVHDESWASAPATDEHRGRHDAWQH